MIKHLKITVLFLVLFGTSSVFPEEWMPDPALREVVSEQLGVENFTQADILELHNLIAFRRNIVELKGLEHAKNLGFLDLGGNQISDLRPLAGLTHLEVLRLWDNKIKDISPLAGLVNLRELSLSGNPISDLSPLIGLENLENLEIYNTNTKGFLSTIPISKLMQFGYDETCDLEGVPISERVESREYPSVATLFGNIINLPHLSWKERLAYHDLYGSSQLFDLQWLPTAEGLKTFLHVEFAKEDWDDMLSLNPNMLFIVGMNYIGANPGEYPDDWPYWLRDESGNRIEKGPNPQIDFTYPGYQDLMVRRAVQFAKCGLFDGIFFDFWRDDWRNRGEEAHYYTYDVHEAAITMLRRIREGVDAVRDNFLIIVNTNDTKIPHSAPYVNGMFLETIGPYHRQHLAEIESTLLWGEQNLREPQINWLEGWSLTNEPFDSPKNQQRMRLFTTMSLTLSDGYISYVVGISGDNHQHAYEVWTGHSDEHARGVVHAHLKDPIWYSFYDAPLGRPVGGDETKGVLYKTPKGVSIEGLFIREFTNGWAVYNRSGEAQEISLPTQATSVASGITSRTHTVPDLDGEMYLKSKSGLETPPIADINGDGVVNIQDLVIVANALGKAEPDLNGDGVVNIQDLVIVANAF